MRSLLRKLKAWIREIKYNRSFMKGYWDSYIQQRIELRYTKFAIFLKRGEVITRSKRQAPDVPKDHTPRNEHNKTVKYVSRRLEDQFKDFKSDTVRFVGVEADTNRSHTRKKNIIKTIVRPKFEEIKKEAREEQPTVKEKLEYVGLLVTTVVAGLSTVIALVKAIFDIISNKESLYDKVVKWMSGFAPEAIVNVIFIAVLLAAVVHIFKSQESWKSILAELAESIATLFIIPHVFSHYSTYFADPAVTDNVFGAIFKYAELGLYLSLCYVILFNSPISVGIRKLIHNKHERKLVKTTSPKKIEEWEKKKAHKASVIIIPVLSVMLSAVVLALSPFVQTQILCIINFVLFGLAKIVDAFKLKRTYKEIWVVREVETGKIKEVLDRHVKSEKTS